MNKRNKNVKKLIKTEDLKNKQHASGDAETEDI